MRNVILLIKINSLVKHDIDQNANLLLDLNQISSKKMKKYFTQTKL